MIGFNGPALLNDWVIADVNPVFRNDLISGLNINQWYGGLTPEENLSALQIPGATLDPVNTVDRFDLPDFDGVFERLGVMQSGVAARKAYYNNNFEALEERKISLNKSQSHIMDTDIAEESTNIARE